MRPSRTCLHALSWRLIIATMSTCLCLVYLSVCLIALEGAGVRYFWGLELAYWFKAFFYLFEWYPYFPIICHFHSVLLSIHPYDIHMYIHYIFIYVQNVLHFGYQTHVCSWLNRFWSSLCLSMARPIWVLSVLMYQYTGHWDASLYQEWEGGHGEQEKKKIRKRR